MEAKRCQATNKRGGPCKAPPLKGEDCCAIHAGETTYPDFSDPDVQARYRKRDVRGRLAEDAAEVYEEIRQKLKEALTADTVRWGSCPGCGKRVPVEFPDFNARVKAIQLWLDQGFGRPHETHELHPAESKEELAFLGGLIAELSFQSRAEIKAVLLRQHPELAELEQELAPCGLPPALLDRRPELVRRGD